MSLVRSPCAPCSRAVTSTRRNVTRSVTKCRGAVERAVVSDLTTYTIHVSAARAAPWICLHIQIAEPNGSSPQLWAPLLRSRPLRPPPPRACGRPQRGLARARPPPPPYACARTPRHLPAASHKFQTELGRGRLFRRWPAGRSRQRPCPPRRAPSWAPAAFGAFFRAAPRLSRPQALYWALLPYRRPHPLARRWPHACPWRGVRAAARLWQLLHTWRQNSLGERVRHGRAPCRAPPRQGAPRRQGVQRPEGSPIPTHLRP